MIGDKVTTDLGVRVRSDGKINIKSGDVVNDGELISNAEIEFSHASAGILVTGLGSLKAPSIKFVSLSSSVDVSQSNIRGVISGDAGGSFAVLLVAAPGAGSLSVNLKAGNLNARNGYISLVADNGLVRSITVTPGSRLTASGSIALHSGITSGQPDQNGQRGSLVLSSTTRSPGGISIFAENRELVRLTDFSVKAKGGDQLIQSGDSHIALGWTSFFSTADRIKLQGSTTLHSGATMFIPITFVEIEASSNIVCKPRLARTDDIDLYTIDGTAWKSKAGLECNNGDFVVKSKANVRVMINEHIVELAKGAIIYLKCSANNGLFLANLLDRRFGDVRIATYGKYDVILSPGESCAIGKTALKQLACRRVVTKKFPNGKIVSISEVPLVCLHEEFVLLKTLLNLKSFGGSRSAILKLAVSVDLATRNHGQYKVNSAPAMDLR